MPDSPLYPVKLATEQAQLTMTPTNLGKAKLSAKLADRRVAEIVYVLNKGESEQIEPTTQHLSKHLIMIASLPLAESGTKRAPTLEAPVPSQQPAKAPVPPPPEAFAPPEPAVEGGQFGEGVPVPVDARARLKLLLQRYAVNHPAVLRMVLERAPESAKPALRRAIAESIASYSKAIEALD
jgi:hypothetical protein